MTDPFADLREPITPVDPTPAFTRRLRARVERALSLPRGVVPMTTGPTDTHHPRPAAVPYLAVADARAAIDWYIEVFDAEPVGETVVMPDGRVGHAELRIGDGVLYLSDEHPEIGVTAPRSGEAAVSMMLPVSDADVVRGRAIDRGATGDRPPYDGYGTRNAWIVDPFGHRWGLNSPLPAAAPIACRPGDLTHLSLRWPDPDRAHAFYAEVLGWRYLDDGRVDGSAVSIGFWHESRPAVVCAYATDDIDAAAGRVRTAGGRVDIVEDEPWGRVARCVDDQGTRFTLHEVDGETAGREPPVNGEGPGELSYLTLQVVESAPAREFYGAVLGWGFRRGRVEDGWAVDGARPMTGLSGGHASATAVPMWTVRDVPAAVAAVRALGGTATDPEQQPYGLSSRCVDDQGMEFYLGET